MHTKKEVKEKLIEAEKAYQTAMAPEKSILSGVISALLWVVNAKVSIAPKDPVSGK